jgi:hypothetical protein
MAVIGRTTPTSAHNASDQIRKLRPAEWVRWSICAAKILSRACRLLAALCLLKLEDTLPIVFHANQCPVALLRCI